eukprot:TRINITY_DN14994_c0_g1_i1.p1 TRINITY_DN14994_c0_g1~~TRINITY_DN14994_c0_g1_i1.p1  ORF type:complete len:304 (+),score=116.88 TRINITY_DN14994_c0_g1_i1:78-989(+)
MADATEVKTEEIERKEEAPEGGKDGKGKKGGKSKGKGAGKGQSKGKPSGPFGGGQGYRLNVKNLGNETGEQLKGMFDPFGTVTDAQVKTREDGKSRGFGFVIFSSEEEAQKAISEMHDKEHNGKKLSVAPAERRPQEDVPLGLGGGMGKGKGKGKGGMAEQQTMMQQQQAAMAMQQQYQFMVMQQYQLQMAAMMQQQQQLQQQQQPIGWEQGGTWYPPAAAGDVGGAAAGAAETTMYEGSVKSINKNRSYGFICCKATHDLYGRDVYLEGSLMPESLKPADRIKFQVTLSDKKHPRASWIALA